MCFDLAPNESAAYRAVNNLANRGKIHEIGRIRRYDYGGRSIVLYCKWFPSRRKLFHEYDTSRICLSYPLADWKRGNRVDERVRADGDGTNLSGPLDHRMFHLERDTGEETHKQLGRLFARHVKSDGAMLFVAQTDRRIDEILKDVRPNGKRLVDPVASKALFSTLAAVLADPYGPIWINVNREARSIYLPKETP